MGTPNFYHTLAKRLRFTNLKDVIYITLTYLIFGETSQDGQTQPHAIAVRSNSTSHHNSTIEHPFYQSQVPKLTVNNDPTKVKSLDWW